MKTIALVTGASAGIGKDTAKVLLQNGYTVYGAARRSDKMDDLKKLGLKAIQMDVSEDSSMVKGIEEIIKAEGRIDVLINNAGFGSYGALEDVSMHDARYQMEVNVFGLARLTQLVLPYMRAQQTGKIVNVTSIGGKIANPLGGWYHASKFAVEALSDTLRLEVKEFGIDVIVIEPGGIKTEWAGIAENNLRKVSGNTVYKHLVNKVETLFKKFNPKGSPTAVISALILKAIKARHPKTRYHAGYMAGMILFMRKILSDKQFDRMIMSQFK